MTPNTGAHRQSCVGGLQGTLAPLAVSGVHFHLALGRHLDMETLPLGWELKLGRENCFGLTLLLGAMTASPAVQLPSKGVLRLVELKLVFGSFRLIYSLSNSFHYLKK